MVIWGRGPPCSLGPFRQRMCCHDAGLRRQTLVAALYSLQWSIQAHWRTSECAQVIRMVLEGLAAFLLDRTDSSKTMIRAIARELLGSAVLRNLMFYFTPYTINKVRRCSAGQVCTSDFLSQGPGHCSRALQVASVRSHRGVTGTAWQFHSAVCL